MIELTITTAVVILAGIAAFATIAIKIVTACFMSKCNLKCCWGMFQNVRHGEQEQSVRHLNDMHIITVNDLVGNHASPNSPEIV